MPKLQKKDYLRPEVLAKISRLDLRAKQVVEGFLSGMHKSNRVGRSVEFRQHREYAHGDDLRRIDWKVWAKQDRFYIKQNEDNPNMRCTLLVDSSESMLYGAGAMTKYDYAATLATSIAYLLLRQQDGVSLVTFDEGPRNTIPSRTRRNHLETIIGALRVEEPREKTSMESTLRHVAENFPRRGMMVLISDLFADRESLFEGIKLLSGRGHEVLVFHLLDEDELKFPFSGPTRFEGLEMSTHLRCNPRALRQGYLEAMHEYLTEVHKGCSKYHVSYAMIDTGKPLDESLATFLASRSRVRM